MITICQGYGQDNLTHDDWVAHIKAERELTECHICERTFKTAHSKRQHVH